MTKYDKYRWHDLRKDPDDLPTHDGLYAIAIDYNGLEVGFGQWETVFGYGSGWTALMPQVQAVVAWKEIEPFEVSE